MLLPIHIAAGGLAIVLGAVALSVKKGGTIHRRSGLLFVYAMLIMAVSASILSLVKGRADGNDSPACSPRISSEPLSPPYARYRPGRGESTPLR